MDTPYKEIYDCIDRMFHSIEEQSDAVYYESMLFWYECELFWKYETIRKYHQLVEVTSARHITCDEVKSLETHGSDPVSLPPVDYVDPMWTFNPRGIPISVA